MLDSSKSRLFITVIGLVSLHATVIYYLAFENEIREYRVTYSIESTGFAEYDSLPSIEITKGKSKVQLSVNYLSISDTAQGQGLKRFELRKYSYGPMLDLDYLDKRYFQHECGLEIPRRIKVYHLGNSKPLGKSVGLGLIILALGMLIMKLLSLRGRNSAH